MKSKTVVFYGGKSAEHDISIITALQVFKFSPGLKRVYIDEQNRWWLVRRFDLSAAGHKRKKHISAFLPVVMLPGSRRLYARFFGGRLLLPLFEIECAVCCFHGLFGEDGCAQGMFEMCGVAYTGSGVAASAAGMDKGMFKTLLKGLGVPHVPGFVLTRAEFCAADNIVDTGGIPDAANAEYNRRSAHCASENVNAALPKNANAAALSEPVSAGADSASANSSPQTDSFAPPRLCTRIREIVEKLQFPLIVKPLRLGSSIGIGVAHDAPELAAALEVAFCFDNAVLIERAVEDFHEINCSALCLSGGRVLTSRLERPVSAGEVLSFADKYLAGGGKDGKSGAKHIQNAERDLKTLQPQPQVECKFERRIRRDVEKICRAMNVCGVCRVDCIVTEKAYYINEINTIPGSLSYHLWQDKFTRAEFLCALTDAARRRKAAADALLYAYKSEVLQRPK